MTARQRCWADSIEFERGREQRPRTVADDLVEQRPRRLAVVGLLVVVDCLEHGRTFPNQRANAGPDQNCLDSRSSSGRCAPSRHPAEDHPQVLIIAPVPVTAEDLPVSGNGADGSLTIRSDPEAWCVSLNSVEAEPYGEQ